MAAELEVAIVVIAVGLGALMTGAVVVAGADGAGAVIDELAGADGAGTEAGEEGTVVAVATDTELIGAELAGGVPDEAPLSGAGPGTTYELRAV